MSDVRKTLGDLDELAPASFDGTEVMEAYKGSEGQSYKTPIVATAAANTWTGDQTFEGALNSTGTLGTGFGTAAARDADNLPALISDVDDTGSVTNDHLQANLASRASTASGDRAVNVACRDVTASGVLSVNLASDGFSIASGTRSANVAAEECIASGSRSINMAGELCSAPENYSATVASRRVINNSTLSLALGEGGSSGSASTANRKIHLFGSSGNIQIAGTLTSSHTFTDFAEMFANNEPTEIPAGTILTHDGGGVKIAQDGDDIAGVVSHTAAVLAGDSPFCWQGRYLHDEFGRRIYEDIADPDYEGEGAAPMISVQKENPDWDSTQEQVARSDRPDEWTPVGLLGQVYVRVNDTVAVGDKVKAGANGIGAKATKKTGLRCMTITQDYDAGLGYAVARCMINVAV